MVNQILMETPRHYLRCSKLGQEVLSNTSFPKNLFNRVCSDIIDLYELNFYEGSAIKYLWRLGESGKSVESDLNKAIHCAKMAVERKVAILIIREIADLSEYIITLNLDFPYKSPE